jgi:hypothetical protein
VRSSGMTTSASRRASCKATDPTNAHGFRRRDFPDAIRFSRNMSPASPSCRLEEAEDRFSSSGGNAGNRQSVRTPGLPREGYVRRLTKSEGWSQVAITPLIKHFEGQMELLVGEGNGLFKSHCVCPREGSCLQKVITRCRSGHGLLRKFVMSCRSRNGKGRQLWTSSLAPSYRCANPALITVLSTVFRKEKWRIVGAFLCGFCSRDR